MSTSEVAIGKIRTSHGVRGEVKVLSYSGVFDHFEALKTVSARKNGVAKTLKVEATRWVGDNLLLKFEGYDSLEIVKSLSDFELWVPKEQAAPLEEGEVYFADLIGCTLLFEGQSKGLVTGFLDGAAAVLLEVERTEGGVVIVPFQEVYLGTVDLHGRTIELKVDWILQ